MHDLMSAPTEIASMTHILKCSPELLCRCDEFSMGLSDACDIVRHFAIGHGWEEQLIPPFVSSFHVFSEQDDMWRKIRELTGSDEQEPPTDGLSAALIDGILLAITPEDYEQRRPEYTQVDKPWVRLLAHEIMHQLHIRIVGHEDRMGPQWFYEGFAMYGAGQHISNHPLSSIHDVIDAMHAQSRGSYAKFEAVFEFCLSRIDLNTLLKQAAQKDFQLWLMEAIGPLTLVPEKEDKDK